MAAAVSGTAVMDGVLVVRKEAGWTSHDVVAKVRQLLGGVKVGHAGTLDPAATGVLPVLIGKGTRIAEYLIDWDKEYRAVLRLGETTDTQDATGTLLAVRATEGVTEAAVRGAVEAFRGPIEQVPPMYSAIKVSGVPLYKSARAGQTVAREARTVVVHQLEILGIEGRDVTLHVCCSKGTYVRTLCADIGEALGVGGHMLALERTRVGSLTLEQALTVEEVATKAALGRLREDLLSLDLALGNLPSVTVDAEAAARVHHGAPFPVACAIREDGAAAGRTDGPLRIHDGDGRLLAIGHRSDQSGGIIAVDKVFVTE